MSGEQWRQSMAGAMGRLAPLVGTWRAVGTYGEPGPDGQSPRQEGIWIVGWLFDQRHLKIEFDVMVNGWRSQYQAIFSYNPMCERYESVWVGSSGYRFAETGVFEGDTLVMVSQQERPDEPGTIRVESRFRFLEDGTVRVTDISEHADGRSVTTFDVALSRAG